MASRSNKDTDEGLHETFWIQINLLSSENRSSIQSKCALQKLLNISMLQKPFVTTNKVKIDVEQLFKSMFADNELLYSPDITLYTEWAYTYGIIQQTRSLANL